MLLFLCLSYRRCQAAPPGENIMNMMEKLPVYVCVSPPKPSGVAYGMWSGHAMCTPHTAGPRLHFSACAALSFLAPALPTLKTLDTERAYAADRWRG